MKAYDYPNMQYNQDIYLTSTGDVKGDVLLWLNTFKEFVTEQKYHNAKVTMGSHIDHYSLTAGLCAHINYLHVCGKVITLDLYALFRMWPEYSGSINYPVPSCEKNLRPSAMYDYVKWGNSNDVLNQEVGLYSRNHEYGKARLRLLDFIIEKVDKEFDQYALYF